MEFVNHIEHPAVKPRVDALLGLELYGRPESRRIGEPNFRMEGGNLDRGGGPLFWASKNSAARDSAHRFLRNAVTVSSLVGSEMPGFRLNQT